MNETYFLFEKHMVDLLGLNDDVVSLHLKMSVGETPLLHVTKHTKNIVNDELELKDDYYKLEISESLESDLGFKVELVDQE